MLFLTIFSAVVLGIISEKIISAKVVPFILSIRISFGYDYRLKLSHPYRWDVEFYSKRFGLIVRKNGFNWFSLTTKWKEITEEEFNKKK